MQKKLLYWFEALGLLWEMEKGRIGMKIMQNWCKVGALLIQSMYRPLNGKIFRIWIMN